MTDWTHGICAACWNAQQPESPAEEICVSDADVCCWCGRVTAGGIYLRADGRELPHCAGHPELRPGDLTARGVTGVILQALDACVLEADRLPHPDDGWRIRLLTHPDGPGACTVLVYPAEPESRAETEVADE